MSKNDKVEIALLSLIQQLNDAMDIMETLEEENRPALVKTVSQIVQSFGTLHELESSITGSVPIELIQQIDLGNNPDDYSRKMIEESNQRAKRSEEKQKWMKQFGDCIGKAIDNYTKQDN